MTTTKELLRSVYGYDSFREGQEAIIDSVLLGKRTLGIMPTGGGKSLTYQLPAMLLPGTTMVVSPLISLMKNQVDELVAAGVPATMINSGVTINEIKKRLADIKNGVYKLFFIAPERLEDPYFYRFIQALPLSLVVIDEVHVLSQWGHDFRPSYLASVDLIEKLSNKPNLMALTATATQKVQADLVNILSIDKTVKTGFARDNLAIKIQKGLSQQEKFDFVIAYAKNNPNDIGIIYAGTRKLVDETSELLVKSGISARAYHAGMLDYEREAAQDAFLYDDCQVMVATNAFGMGINKTNVRYIIHLGMPGSIEAYYQEIGRAGRDGLASETVLLASPRDVQLQRFFIDNADNQTPEYRQRELAKLQEMTGFTATQDCLQHYIVQYFGEQIPPCGICSTCTDTRELTDMTLAAQKVLSNIVRMGQLQAGNYSKTQVVAVLRGKLAEKMRWTGFDTLSTYGLLSDWPVKKLNQFIDYLVADGYLLVSGEYNGLSISEKGIGVLKSEQSVMLREIKTTQPIKKTYSRTREVGGELFELLRKQRSIFAKELSLPPFMIFSDQVLMNMAEAEPETRDQLLTVSGIGEKKADQFGSDFLAIIKQFKQVT